MTDLIVKISDKSGDRFEKVNFLEKVFRIGRAWDNDLILQDKFVDPHHLAIQLDESKAVSINDLASKNGSVIGRKNLRGESTLYSLGDTIRIGDTRLAFYDETAKIEPAALRSSWFLIGEKFNSFVPLIALTLVALLLFNFDNWFFSRESLTVGEGLTNSGALLILTGGASVLLGFLSKLIRGEFNFKKFWILSCFGIILLAILTLVVRLLRFNSADLQVGEFISTGIYGLLIIWFLFGVFTFSSYLSRASKWAWSTLIVIATFGLVQSNELLREEHENWDNDAHIENVTLPPAFLLRKAVSTDSYQQATDALFDFDLE